MPRTGRSTVPGTDWFRDPSAEEVDDEFAPDEPVDADEPETFHSDDDVRTAVDTAEANPVDVVEQWDAVADEDDDYDRDA